MKKLTHVFEQVMKTELKSQQVQVDGIFSLFIWTIKRNLVTVPYIQKIN